ncbi:hypothetical protein HK405_005324, partial [Cladochytrium tenue]
MANTPASAAADTATAVAADADDCYYARILECGQLIIPHFDIFGQAVALLNCMAVVLGVVAIVLQRHWRATRAAAAVPGGPLSPSPSFAAASSSSSLSVVSPTSGRRPSCASPLPPPLNRATSLAAVEEGKLRGPVPSPVSFEPPVSMTPTPRGMDRLETCLIMLTASCVPSAVAMVLSSFFNTVSIIFFSLYAARNILLYLAMMLYSDGILRVQGLASPVVGLLRLYFLPALIVPLAAANALFIYLGYRSDLLRANPDDAAFRSFNNISLAVISMWIVIALLLLFFLFAARLSVGAFLKTVTASTVARDQAETPRRPSDALFSPALEVWEADGRGRPQISALGAATAAVGTPARLTLPTQSTTAPRWPPSPRSPEPDSPLYGMANRAWPGPQDPAATSLPLLVSAASVPTAAAAEPARALSPASRVSPPTAPVLPPSLAQSSGGGGLERHAATRPPPLTILVTAPRAGVAPQASPFDAAGAPSPLTATTPTAPAHLALGVYPGAGPYAALPTQPPGGATRVGWATASPTTPTAAASMAARRQQQQQERRLRRALRGTRATLGWLALGTAVFVAFNAFNLVAIAALGGAPAVCFANLVLNWSSGLLVCMGVFAIIAVQR